MLHNVFICTLTIQLYLIVYNILQCLGRRRPASKRMERPGRIMRRAGSEQHAGQHFGRFPPEEEWVKSVGSAEFRHELIQPRRLKDETSQGSLGQKWMKMNDALYGTAYTFFPAMEQVLICTLHGDLLHSLSDNVSHSVELVGPCCFGWWERTICCGRLERPTGDSCPAALEIRLSLTHTAYNVNEGQAWLAVVTSLNCVQLQNHLCCSSWSLDAKQLRQLFSFSPLFDFWAPHCQMVKWPCVCTLVQGWQNSYGLGRKLLLPGNTAKSLLVHY